MGDDKFGPEERAQAAAEIEAVDEAYDLVADYLKRAGCEFGSSMQWLAAVIIEEVAFQTSHPIEETSATVLDAAKILREWRNEDKAGAH